MKADVDEIYFENEEAMHISHEPMLIHKMSIERAPQLFETVQLAILDINEISISVQSNTNSEDWDDINIENFYRNTISKNIEMYKYIYKQCLQSKKRYRIFYKKEKITEYEYEEKKGAPYDKSKFLEIVKIYFEKIDNEKKVAERKLLENEIKINIQKVKEESKAQGGESNINKEINFGF